MTNSSHKQTTTGTPEASQHAVTDYFNVESSGWASRYSNNRHFQRRLEVALQWTCEALSAKALPHATLLDYGCGGGVLVKALAEAGHVVTGVDISEGMLAAAQALVKPESQQHTVQFFRVDEAFQGDYQREQYDGVFSLGVLEYLDNPHALLKELATVIQAGGFLVLSFPNRQSLLRQCEKTIFQNPSLFKALGLFPHLTGETSYLQFQKHTFSVSEMDALLAPLGLQRIRTLHHVSPQCLKALESFSGIGMTTIVQYQKAPNAGNSGV